MFEDNKAASGVLQGFSSHETIILAAVAYHTNKDGDVNWDKVVTHLGSKSVSSCKERLRLAKKKVYAEETSGDVSGTTTPTGTEKAAPKSKATTTPRKSRTPKRKADEADGTAEDGAEDTETPSKKPRKARTSKAKVNAEDGNKTDDKDDNEATAAAADGEEPATPAKKPRKPRTPKAKKVEDGAAENDKTEDGTPASTKKPRAKPTPKAKGGKKNSGEAEQAGTENVAATVNVEDTAAAAAAADKSASVFGNETASPDAALDADLDDKDAGHDTENNMTVTVQINEDVVPARIVEM